MTGRVREAPAAAAGGEVTGTRVVREPGDARQRGNRCRATGRRGRAAARGVHADRGAGWPPPPRSDRAGRTADARREDGGLGRQDRRARSLPGRWCTEPPTSAATSSGASSGARNTNRPKHNPMIGYRGCYRYVQASRSCSRSSWRRWPGCASSTPTSRLMIPFVRTRWELEECLALVDGSALGRQRGLHRWVMAEVPSVVHWLPEYIGMGIDGVSIGSNDLTQLVLGVDRDSDVCAELFDESDPAVLRRHSPHHRDRQQVRNHLLAVRAGPVDQPGVRRTPGASGHHVGVGQPGRRRRHPAGHRRRRTPDPARRRAMTATLTAPLPSRDRIASGSVGEAFALLGTSADGLSSAEAQARLHRLGANVVRTHPVSALAVLRRQLANAVLGLLAVTAALSYFLGDSAPGRHHRRHPGGQRRPRLLQRVPRRKSLRSTAFRDPAQRGGATGRDLPARGRQRAGPRRRDPADHRRAGARRRPPHRGHRTGVQRGHPDRGVRGGREVHRAGPRGSRLADCVDLAFMGTVVSAGEATAVVFATGAGRRVRADRRRTGASAPETDVPDRPAPVLLSAATGGADAHRGHLRDQHAAAAGR